MASILAHIQIKSGSEALFEAITRRLYKATHEQEPECLRYEYWRAETPGRYYCFLCFTDYAAFMRHQVSDHHEVEAETLREIIEDIRLEWLDPVEPAAGFPLTEEAAEPDDADELTKSYAEMFPVLLAGWWGAVRAA